MEEDNNFSIVPDINGFCEYFKNIHKNNRDFYSCNWSQIKNDILRIIENELKDKSNSNLDNNDHIYYMNNVNNVIMDDNIIFDNKNDNWKENNFVEANRISIEGKNIIKKYFDITNLINEINLGKYNLDLTETNYEKRNIFLGVILGNIFEKWVNELPTTDMLLEIKNLTDKKKVYLPESKFVNNFTEFKFYFAQNKDKIKDLYKFYLDFLHNSSST